MLQKNHPIGKKSSTAVIFIGVERFQGLADIAIEVSYKGKRQITPSQMAQYTLDNFMEVAREKLLLEIQE